MPEHPLPFKLALSEQHAEVFRREYSNQIVIEEPDAEGMCMVHIRVDSNMDLLSIFHAGCKAVLEARKSSAPSLS